MARKRRYRTKNDNYKLSENYRVFNGKRYKRHMKCGSHEEALKAARSLRNNGNCLAEVYHNEVYVKRKA